MTSTGLGPFIGLGVDLFFYVIFYKWYRKLNRLADEIKTAPYRKLDNKLIVELSESKSPYIPYACIEGEVIPIGNSLQSHHIEGKHGVIQHISVTELRSKKLGGVWSDVTNIIQDKVQSVPFVLRRWFCKESQTEIVVDNPTSASFLMESLTVTHDSFKHSQGGNILSRGLDLMYGDVSKGIHHNEKMLLTNTLLLGIGEIALNEGKLHLLPPRDKQMYILTTMSRAEVIRSLSSRSVIAKILVITTGVIGSSLVAYIIYKQIKQWRQGRARDSFLREINELREQAANRANNSNNEYGSSCIVCFTNRREIVLLNCGHICLCAECVLMLPEPLLCPVCRSPVERYILTYNP